MSGVVSRWLGGIEQLEFIAERLIRVQIENRPAIDVIKLYDSKETLFYCAPPISIQQEAILNLTNMKWIITNIEFWWKY
jgi:site-specific DNA-adenine methylase